MSLIIAKISRKCQFFKAKHPESVFLYLDAISSKEHVAYSGKG
jgi:hypothetical protein